MNQPVIDFNGLLNNTAIPNLTPPVLPPQSTQQIHQINQINQINQMEPADDIPIVRSSRLDSLGGAFGSIPIKEEPKQPQLKPIENNFVDENVLDDILGVSNTNSVTQQPQETQQTQQTPPEQQYTPAELLQQARASYQEQQKQQASQASQAQQQVHVEEKPQAADKYQINYGQEIEDTPPPEEQKPKPSSQDETSDFDLNTMNKSLDATISDIKIRIKALQTKQQSFDAKLTVLEKFMQLDQKDLALEYSKGSANSNDKVKLNYSQISVIQGKITSKMELINETMDLFLKLEDSIYKWIKEITAIEKEKLASYAKLRALNKEITSSEDGINNIIQSVNESIKTNPDLAKLAVQELSISGYSGKPFGN